MDENGTMLSIPEVRERMRTGLPLVLNKEANWNNKQKTTKEEYLDSYMAKNLYYINCTFRSEFGTEDKKYNPADYVALMPTGYYNDMEKVPTSLMMPTGSGNHHIRNKNRPSILSKQTIYLKQTDHLFAVNRWSVFIVLYIGQD